MLFSDFRNYAVDCGTSMKITFSSLALLFVFLFLPGQQFQALGAEHAFDSLTGTKGSPLSYDRWVKVLSGEDPVRLVLVEKDRQRLQVLEYNGEIKTIAEYPCATGENNGKKQVSGDSRTPEGIYFITKIFTDRKVTIFGKRALHLDYPNIFDKNSGRNGDGIYIHGTNKELKPNSTNGCITLHNSDLDELVGYLQKDLTPIVIVPSRDVFKYQEIKYFDNRLDLLTPLLLPEEIGLSNVKFASLYLINDGLQTVAVGEFIKKQNEYSSVSGYSRSYLEFTPGRGWFSRDRIWQTSPIHITSTPVKVKVAAADVVPEYTLPVYPKDEHVPENTLPDYPKDEQLLLDFIEKWRQAWQSKQIDEYIDCYLDTFVSRKMNRAAWKKYKARLNRKYKTISVKLSAPKIDWTDKGAKVTFRQQYKSDTFAADGRKTLHLLHEGDRWGITRELWLN